MAPPAHLIGIFLFSKRSCCWQSLSSDNGIQSLMPHRNMYSVKNSSCVHCSEVRHSFVIRSVYLFTAYRSCANSARNLWVFIWEGHTVHWQTLYLCVIYILKNSASTIGKQSKLFLESLMARELSEVTIKQSYSCYQTWRKGQFNKSNELLQSLNHDKIRLIIIRKGQAIALVCV